MEAAESLHDRLWLAWAPSYLGTLTRLEGDWKVAQGLFSQAMESLSQFAVALGGKALAHYEVGEFEEGDSSISALVEMARAGSVTAGEDAGLATTVTLASHITGVADNLDMAEKAALAVLATPTIRRDFAVLARAGLALLAVRRQDAEAAGAQYSDLLSQQGTMLITICVDRLLGLLAHTMGKFEAAADHFKEALTFCRKANYHPELAWTLHDYADMLLQRGQPGDQQIAATMLDEALQVSADLGMRPLTERVMSKKGKVTHG